jgi:uncharacterized damage-inducible protein DinB
VATSGVEQLKRQAEYAYSQLLEVLEGVTEGQAWARLPQVTSEYLHTDGSIYGITLHIASVKRLYGSCAFRDNEIRWRDCIADLEKFEPSWTAVLDYLAEGHRYWMSTWADLQDEDLEREVKTFRHTLTPTWKIIAIMNHHDAYHAGQIPVIRYAIGESTEPPLSVAEDIRQCCSDLPSW